MSDTVTVRFRVADVYSNRSIAVYYGDERVMSRKKRVMAPGEMEQVIIKRSDIDNRPDVDSITVCVEE